MLSERSALVVGGGLAGLAAAIILRKLGINVDVYESHRRNDLISANGSGLTVQGVTLRTLGLVDENALERCLAAGAGQDRMLLGDAAGNILEERTIERIADPNLPASFGVMRTTLWETLADIAQSYGVGIEFSTAVTSIDQDRCGVDVTLSNGEHRRFGIVIGADGINSTVRSLVFPDADEPRYSGQTSWRVIVPLPDGGLDYASHWYSKRLKVGLRPVSTEQAYLYFLENTERRKRPPRETWVQTVHDLLSDFSGLMGDVRASVTDQDLVGCYPLRILLMDDPWYRGRVLLIGDATHSTTPHLGMGAGLGFEDAVVLGDVIATEPTVDQAFAQFMSRRHDRVRLVVSTSERLGAAEQDGGCLPWRRASSPTRPWPPWSRAWRPWWSQGGCHDLRRTVDV